MKPLDKSRIEKVLVISLTNIGDVVLTFPVIDILKENLPEAKISVVIGPKTRSLLEGNPCLQKVYVFNKRQPFKETWSLLRQLRRDRYDLVVDLRNTAIPLFIGPHYRTSIMATKNERHMKENHIKRLNSVFPFYATPRKKYALYISPEDKRYIQEIIEREVRSDRKIVVVSPGAANRDKRWTEQGFAQVADGLIEKYNCRIVFIGSEEDAPVVSRIKGLMKGTPVDLCGRISLPQSAALMRQAALAIVNDSAPLHIASYLDIPVLAIFGPSDPLKYGPWSAQAEFIKSRETCRRCQDPKQNIEHTCLSSIKPEEVLSRIEMTPQGIHFKRDERI